VQGIKRKSRRHLLRSKDHGGGDRDADKGRGSMQDEMHEEQDETGDWKRMLMQWRSEVIMVEAVDPLSQNHLSALPLPPVPASEDQNQDTDRHRERT